MASKSIYEVDLADTALAYPKHSIATFLGSPYYALRDIEAGTSFSDEIWGGYTVWNDSFKTSFLWIPSYGGPVSNAPLVKVNKFGDGYEQRIREGLNNKLLTIDLTFDLRTQIENRAICHFLDSRGALESFVYTPLAPFNALKLFVCRQWDSVQEFYNNYSIKARFEEVVF